MVDVAKKAIENATRKPSTPLTEGEVVLSMSFLDDPLRSSHGTQVEIWGFLGGADTEKYDLQTVASVLSSDSAEPVRQRPQHQKHGMRPRWDGQHSARPRFDKGFLVQGLSRVEVKSVAVGGNHAMFISWQGEAFCYGSNDCGQLGTGDFESRSVAAKVPCIAVDVEELPHTARGSSDSQDMVSYLPTVRTEVTEIQREAHVIAAACGSYHTVLLSRVRSAHTEVGAAAGDNHRLFVCGLRDALGILADCDQPEPLMVPELKGVRAVAARGEASCCAAPRAACSDPQYIYLWGEVHCLEYPASFDHPTATFHVPAAVEDVSLGAFFGLALDSNGEVYAWGDGTYGELGGADAAEDCFFRFDDMDENSANLRVPGKVTLPVTHATNDTNDMANDRVRIVGLSCGEMHSLLLSTDGRVFSFGQNLSGQCGIREAHGTTHLTSGCVMEPTRVPWHAGEPKPSEVGENVLAGTRHSAIITKEGRLYLWGDPSSHKLGHIDLTDDGTHFRNDPKKKDASRVCVRSPHHDAVRTPRLAVSFLNRRVCALGLGDECTIIVSGMGAVANTKGF
eukprot:TRINITY_DN4283_c0_g1_i2.p1 TRINITY_DN4283_c0_g1~~TRINITY_DN4283_c0_g1_i2.p1  ORF type:complete len:565 (+),score=58.37 TRINITY_DN4283_c0_g1_i2:304-1998(+)